MAGKKIQLSDAKCSSMELITPVQFGKADDAESPGDNNNFLMEAYTGEVVQRWWGQLAVALEGIQASDSMPIFRDHSRSKIVGYSEKSYLDGSFYVQGKFSGVTDDAQEVKALADEGFPWQASIGVAPLTILELEPGATAEVNGQELTGPAEIWLTSKVSETSFVPLGADDQTSVCTFSKFNEVAQGDGSPGVEYQSKKGGKIMITLEMLEKDAPDLLAQIRQDAKKQGAIDGAATELARIQGVRGQAMLGHEGLIETLMFDGQTTGPEAAVQVLAAERATRDTALENLKSSGVAPVVAAVPPETESLKKTVKKDQPATKANCQAEFDADPGLLEEFGDFATYFACRDAEQSGRVRIQERK